MNVRTLLILISSLMLFSSCTKKIETVSVCVPKTKLSIVQSAPVKPLPVEWFIITPENAREIFQIMQDENVSLTLFGVTDDNYKNLSVNMSKLRNYIVDQNTIIKAYKNYYEKIDETTTE